MKGATSVLLGVKRLKSVFCVSGHGKFNRAQLMNVGALESSKLYPFQCYIFHDVDLLPEDNRNIYSCPQQPRHMSVAVDIMSYKWVTTPYKQGKKFITNFIL